MQWHEQFRRKIGNKVAKGRYSNRRIWERDEGVRREAKGEGERRRRRDRGRKRRESATEEKLDERWIGIGFKIYRWEMFRIKNISGFTVYILYCTQPRTLYTVQCTLYDVLCTMYTVQCTLYNVLCTMYSEQCTLYSVHCTKEILNRRRGR